MMKIEEFIRRPFDVNAVQVTPQNAAEVAEWCGGKVAKSTYKLAGFDTQLDCVKVPGNGPNKGKMVEARIGSYVVEHEGNFRVFRKQQFHDTFIKRTAEASEYFHVGDLVQDKDGDQGEVVKVEQILVDAPSQGGLVLYSGEELTRIPEYSDKTMEIIKEQARLAAIVPGLDKINSMRESEETHQAITQAFESQQGDLDEPQVIENIGDIKLGSVVRIIDEMNQFFSQCGVVDAFINDNTVAVRMDLGKANGEIVNHLVSEIELETDTKWATVSNENSGQHGWVGWILKDSVDSDLVRIAFRPTTYLTGTPDRCFSYMPDEVTEISVNQLGLVPTYEI